ncbi:hypothetical protein ACFZDI_26760 [Streptomyces sp. NPDC007907]
MRNSAISQMHVSRLLSRTRVRLRTGLTVEECAFSEARFPVTEALFSYLR